MKKNLKILILSVIILLTQSTQVFANTKPKILILHSYHPTLKWTKDLNFGINTVFDDIKKVDKYVEYMDTKQFSQSKYIESLTKIYQQKYKDIKFDLIMSSDNNAFNFLRLHSKELFQNTPVVFSGVNDFKDSLLKNHPNFTGVTESSEYIKNYDLILKLHPNIKNIYFIIDKKRERINTSIKEYNNKNIKFHIIKNLTLGELETTVKNLPKQSAIIFISFTKTKDGKFLEYYTALEYIDKFSTTPIYTVVDQSLDHGAIGGYVRSGFTQGVTAAKIAQEILKGTDVKSIPVVKTSPNKYIFDYREIKRYNINEDKLPFDSIFINRPDTMLELYYKEILTIIILFIMMFIFIIILLFINKKRAKAEKLAKKQLIFQQNLIDNVNTPIYYKNTNCEYIGYNKAFADLMEINQNEVLSKNTKYLNDTQSATIINQKDLDILNNLQPQEYEGSYTLKDGTHKDLIFNKNVFFEDNQLGGIVGSIFDITEINSLNYDLNRLLSTFDANVIASKTDINGKIIYVSQAFVDISKYKQSELLGEKHNILGTGVTKDSTYDELLETISKHRVWTGEIINKNKNGEIYTLHTIITPEYNKNGDFLNFTYISQDITAQKLVEKANHEIEILNEDIVSTQREIIYRLGAIAEARSKETGLHVRRVAKYSEMLALYHGLSQKEAEILKMASPMHDIGKIAIPDAILNKPAKFTEEEFEIMKTHAKLGYDMLKDSNKEILKAAAIIAYEHQEKYDGSGYPRCLKGEDIHIYGRITAIADVFDALGSARVYKKAWKDEAIFQLLKDGAGKHFDPKLIDIFFEHLDEFLKIRDEMKDVF